MKSEKEIEINEELIVKYLSGEATPEEALALHDWRTTPEHKLQFEQLESTWTAAHPAKKASFNKQAAWNKLNNNIEEASSKRNQEKGRVIFFGLSNHVLKIAASFLILVAAGIFTYIKLSETELKNITTLAESETVSLIDNSTVTLYRNTHFDYPVEFKKDTREVKLVKGEAFFKIAHDKSKPFIVHTAIADIKVIGTEFNVTVNDNQAEVSVKEGKVLVYTSNDSIYLTKGLTGSIKTGKDIVVDNNAKSNDWGYATRKLVFKDAPLKAVIKDIEKAYPCSISVSNETINNCHLTATFDNDSIEKIVNLIAEILNLTVKRNDRVFMLEGEGCP
jgi:transmembrane sensor